MSGAKPLFDASDALIVALGKRLHKASRTLPLFTIRWTVA